MAEAEGTVEQREMKKKKKEEIEKKLEEFYRQLEDEGASETLEDVKRLAYESRQLLRKVDTLVEILLQAAESEEEEEEQKVLMDIVKELQELREQLKATADLQHVLDGISETQKDILEKIKLMEAAISKSMEVHFSEVADDLERLKEILPVLDEVREYIKRQIEEKDWLEKELALLDKEIAALTDAFNAFQRLVKGDIDERKRAMEELNKKTEDLVSKIVQLRATLPEEESKRIASLEQRLSGLLSSVHTLLETIKSEEESHRKLLETLISQVRQDLNKMAERLEKLEESVDVLDKEDVQGVKKELDEMEERMTHLVELLQKNGEALKEHSSDVAELLMRMHELSERVSSLEQVVENKLSIVTEKLKLFESVDQRLRELGRELDAFRREREDEMSKESEELRKMLAMVHAELSSILDTLHRHDVLKELEDIHADIKHTLDLLSTKVLTREEAGKRLEELNNRLAELEDVLESGDLGAIKRRLEELSKRLDAIAKSIGTASAVLTEDDLRGIVREVEELRAKVRMLRDAGIYSELEKLMQRLSSLDEKEVHMAPSPARLKEGIRKVRKEAELAGEIAKEKRKKLQDIKKSVQELEKKSGKKTVAKLVLKRVERLDRAARAMAEIEKLSQTVEKKLEKIENGIKKKSVRIVIGSVDADAAAARIISRFLRRLRPGERVDLETIRRKTGLSESLVRKTVTAMERSGEYGIKVHRPFFFGKWYIERLR